jgi:hypothetical protein
MDLPCWWWRHKYTLFIVGPLIVGPLKTVAICKSSVGTIMNKRTELLALQVTNILDPDIGFQASAGWLEKFRQSVTSSPLMPSPESPAQ